jgi:hypothetical protein
MTAGAQDDWFFGGNFLYFPLPKNIGETSWNWLDFNSAYLYNVK